MRIKKHPQPKNKQRKFWKYFLRAIAVLAIGGIIYLAYFILVKQNVTVTNDSFTPYQFHHLRILFFSSLATILAVIVALFRDELRSFWKFAKLVVEPKSTDFIIEEVPATDADVIKAIYYEIVLSIRNAGTLTAKECSIVITELTFQHGTGRTISVDVSLAEQLTWKGKNKDQIIIPSSGGSGQVAILKIEPNTASTPTAAQSQPSILTIGGLDVTGKGNPQSGGQTTWLATFMIFSETCRPVKYILKILWDGLWQDRKNEMLAHITVESF